MLKSSLFFFSSRRRHTRFDCDWSSDVCSSDLVTVAVRRVDLDRTKEEGVLYHLDAKRYFLLANTAGCYTAEDAVRYARLAREAGFNEFIKLEVIGDQETLLPDVQGLLVAARTDRKSVV